MKHHTIVETLRMRADAQPDRVIYSFLRRNGRDPLTLTYRELDRRARSIAAELQLHELSGQNAVLLFPPGESYVSAFFGCLYAGVTAVPCYPPGLTRASSDSIVRVTNDSRAAAVLSSSQWLDDARMVDLLGRCSHSPLKLATDPIDASAHEAYRYEAPRASDLAFLQYTSGSTGDPKGVMVTHGNIAANLHMIQRSFGLSPLDHICLWLPPYHDMGLIGGVLAGITSDSRMTLMEASAFIRTPMLWLQAISDGRATVTGAPNFAFERCVRAAKAQPELLAGLDLSSLEVTFCGAEMIRSETLAAFSDVFQRCGFRPQSFMPCYGMAETTLLCSTRPRQRGYVSRTVDRDSLERDAVVTRPPSHAGKGWTLVGCGSVVEGSVVAIVDPETRTPVADNVVGEVWISGDSVARGYWQRPELNSEVFDQRLNGTSAGGFMRTGDRGFLDGGELYITGRFKDLLIVRGRNYAPEDIESSVAGSHEAIRSHRVVATAVDIDGEERLVVLLECERKGMSDEERQRVLEQILERAHHAIVRDHGLVADVIAVVKTGEVPVTTSGKVQRRRASQCYRRGELTVVTSRGELAASAPALESELQEGCGPAVLDIFQAVAKLRPAQDRRIADLGIDSVTATSLASEIAARFQIDLPPAVLSPDSTLADIIAFVNAHAPSVALASGTAAAPRAANENTGVRHSAPLRKGQSSSSAAGGVVALSPAEFMAKPLHERLDWHQQQVTGLRRTDVLNYHLVQEEKLSATTSRVESNVLTFFSSYSYLGLNNDPEVIEAKAGAVHKYGTGSHGVMLLGGYTQGHAELERALTRNFRTEETLLYSSGFVANMAVIDGLMKSGDFIFCDMLVHTSILDGCRLSGAQVRMFPHQDAEALDRMLERTSSARAKLVIVDGVYSLRGEIANLPALLEVAHRHGALLMVDEAHALGAVGKHGRGTAEHHGVEGQVDLVTGGLGKGIPAYGGYVSGRREIIDYLRFRSNPYVFSGGMDVANVAAASKALQLMNDDERIMQRLRRNIELMESLLEERRIKSLRWGSPCMPVVCEDANEAYGLSRRLRDRGLYVAPITYPAVPKDQQGLRLTVTAAHTPEQIRYAVDQIESTLREMRQPLAPTSTSKRGTTMSSKSAYTPIPEALDIFAKGGFVLVSDDEDRENEGDLVIAGDHVTADAVNFMISHGKGLVCLAISQEIAEQKGLEPMVRRNRDQMGTAFTVSVDGTREHGITTGISAPERAKTIRMIIANDLGPSALAAPGHVFPLVARAGGVLERPGHTEAGVEMARLAGCSTASAAIVEIIKENGEMARKDDLITFSEKFGIPYITIAQLKQYVIEKAQRTAA